MYGGSPDNELAGDFPYIYDKLPWVVVTMWHQGLSALIQPIALGQMHVANEPVNCGG